MDKVTDSFLHRLNSTPNNPFSTSTTANYEKVIPRLERGDGQGCPILAIGIGWKAYTQFEGTIEEEVKRLAELDMPAVPKSKQANIDKIRNDHPEKIPEEIALGL